MLKRFIKISRPRFWSYLGGTFLLGGALGASSLQDLSQPLFLLYLVYFFPFANIFLYVVNDIYDQETDKLNVKKDEKETRFNKEKDQKLQLLLWSIVGGSFVLLALLPNNPSRLFFMLFLALSYWYSAPPFRFKARPFLDFLSNILYIMPGLLAFSLVSGQWPSFWAVLAGWFWVMAMHLYSAIPDIVPDSQAGVQTSAVKLGSKTSIWLCTGFWLVFASIVMKQGWVAPYEPISLIYPIVSFLTLFNVSKIHKIYWYYPWMNTVLGGAAFFLSLPLV